MTRFCRPALAVVVALAAFGLASAEASNVREQPRKHRIFYHLNEAGIEKASAVLTNIQNHVDVVGWQNIEALELVVHGPALKTFVSKGIDPGVRGKLDRLLAGGLKVGACQITMQRQQLKLEELLEGLAALPSGVVRVMELQELGYTYIKP